MLRKLCSTENVPILALAGLLKKLLSMGLRSVIVVSHVKALQIRLIKVCSVDTLLGAESMCC